MARLELIRIDKDGTETILEIMPVPEGFKPSHTFYSVESIEKLEKHYQKTGKPKKSYLDVLYVTRLQKERQ